MVGPIYTNYPSLRNALSFTALVAAAPAKPESDWYWDAFIDLVRCEGDRAVYGPLWGDWLTRFGLGLRRDQKYDVSENIKTILYKIDAKLDELHRVNVLLGYKPGERSSLGEALEMIENIKERERYSDDRLRLRNEILVMWTGMIELSAKQGTVLREAMEAEIHSNGMISSSTSESIRRREAYNKLYPKLMERLRKEYP